MLHFPFCRPGSCPPSWSAAYPVHPWRTGWVPMGTSQSPQKCLSLPEMASEGQVRKMTWERRSDRDGAWLGRLKGKGQGVERPEENPHSWESG